MPGRLDLKTGTMTANEYPDYSSIPEEYLLDLFNTTTPEQKAHFPTVPIKYWHRGVSRKLLHSNRPFPAQFIPYPIKQHTGATEFPDFFSCCGFIAVSIRFKELLEKFEPDVHRFEPVELQDVAGAKRLNEMFILRIGNLIDDGILMEESDAEHQFYKGKIAAIHPTHAPPRITWSAAKVRGLHLWQDVLAESLVTVSDELYAEMKHMQMTGFQAQESRTK